MQRCRAAVTLPPRRGVASISRTLAPPPAAAEAAAAAQTPDAPAPTTPTSQSITLLGRVIVDALHVVPAAVCAVVGEDDRADAFIMGRLAQIVAAAVMEGNPGLAGLVGFH